MTNDTFHLLDLLEGVACKSSGNGVISYPLQRLDQPRQLTYTALRALAVTNGKILRNHLGPQPDRIILIHFEDHLDNILWLWSVVYAGYTPAMSTGFPREHHRCEKHICHLKRLLNDPVCITHSSLQSQFPETSELVILVVDHIDSWANIPVLPSDPSGEGLGQDVALLMLTSGSTGNAKAVCLTHQQIGASLAGKAIALPVGPGDHRSFLNWIRLDHVGSLVEIHLHALYVGVSQVHVQPDYVIATPTLFLDLIDRHRVARTFAPNFFLCDLARVLADIAVSASITRSFDLRCLSYIVSGGEANLVSTCVRISELLSRYGAPANFIVPGFGMTETCAGCIYNLSCPATDLAEKQEFAAVGQCIPGIQMRVTGDEGSLEVSGPIVFQHYYNNEEDTRQSFTADGWFKTGDTATIDAAGCLRLSGRTKDLMSINGIKVLAAELQAAIEEDAIDGIKPGCLVVFSRRPQSSPTEEIRVIYCPTYSLEDLKTRYDTQTTITRTVLVLTGARPYVLPLPAKHLGRSTLGKISGSMIRRALDQGEYHAEEMANAKQIKKYQDLIWSPPADEIEATILEELEHELGVPRLTVGSDTMMFETGLTSVGLIRLKRRIEQRLGLDDIPLITMMKNPSVQLLGAALRTPTPRKYDPVVTINPTGPKTPLWLVHPGVGEILVFLGLGKFLTDRPVHALRARGFNKGETQFADIADTVATYHAAIKATQPQGPYALAGYSYGSMLAFEVAKVLERTGDEVRFVGAFNLPPHIKFRMRQLDWHECFLHLALFLGLIPEISSAIRADIASLPGWDAVEYVVRFVADIARLTELSLTAQKLHRWADLAYGLQSMAQDYEPSGLIAQLDVFYCHPLAVVANSKQQWLENHLSKWSGFVRGDVRYHEVEGEHYTMLAPAHIRSFQATLRKALTARGL